MVQLKGNPIVNISGLQVFKIRNHYVLSNADSADKRKAAIGGTRVWCNLDITDIPDGNLFITQLCKNHDLVIKTNKGLECSFNSNGNIYNDTPNNGTIHYCKTQIKNNLLNGEDKIYFFDAPSVKLEQWFSIVEFKIEFETWFQYNANYGPPTSNYMPLLSFKWSLDSAIKNHGSHWEIIYSKFSPVDSIINSLQFYTQNDRPMIPPSERLHNAVELAMAPLNLP